jgi:hypothetical protein
MIAGVDKLFSPPIGRTRLGTPFGPLLWLIAMCVTCVLGLVHLRCEAMAWVFAVAAIAAMVGLFRAYRFFQRTAPDRLQSEDYQLRREFLRLVKQKAPSIELGKTSLETILAPHMRALTRQSPPREQPDPPKRDAELE